MLSTGYLVAVNFHSNSCVNMVERLRAMDILLRELLRLAELVCSDIIRYDAQETNCFFFSYTHTHTPWEGKLELNVEAREVSGNTCLLCVPSLLGICLSSFLETGQCSHVLDSVVWPFVWFGRPVIFPKMKIVSCRKVFVPRASYFGDQLPASTGSCIIVPFNNHK